MLGNEDLDGFFNLISIILVIIRNEYIPRIQADIKWTANEHLSIYIIWGGTWYYLK